MLLVAFLFVVSGSVGDIYTHLLSPPLDGMRNALGLDIWPHDWPLIVQLFMVFTLNEVFGTGYTALNTSRHRVGGYRDMAHITLSGN